MNTSMSTNGLRTAALLCLAPCFAFVLASFAPAQSRRPDSQTIAQGDRAARSRRGSLQGFRPSGPETQKGRERDLRLRKASVTPRALSLLSWKSCPPYSG